MNTFLGSPPCWSISAADLLTTDEFWTFRPEGRQRGVLLVQKNMVVIIMITATATTTTAAASTRTVKRAHRMSARLKQQFMPW
jgi:hypothetical protein